MEEKLWEGLDRYKRIWGNARSEQNTSCFHCCKWCHGKMWFTMLTTVTKAAGSMLTPALQDSKSAKSDNLQQLEAVQHRYFTLSRLSLSLTSSEHDAHVMCPGRDCGFDITQAFTPRWLTPRCWQDMTQFGHVQTKHFFLPSTAADDVIPRGSGSAGFSCPLSDYLSRPTAHTGSNLKLSNMGTSPFAFLWHLLSMMHMSCIRFMISRCSQTLQKCQSDLVSIPGLCLPSFCFEYACLIFLLLASASGGFDIWWVAFEMAEASQCPRVPELGTYLNACDPFSSENRGEQGSCLIQLMRILRKGSKQRIHMAACTKLHR